MLGDVTAYVAPMRKGDGIPFRRRGRRTERVGALFVICMLATAWLTGTARAGNAPTVTADLVRVVDTSAWAPSSPDPTGLTYARDLGKLLVVDAEVDEKPGPKRRSNLFIATVRGTMLRSRSLIRSSAEPEDIAWRNRSTVFLVDDNSKRVLRIRAGSDRKIGTPDDRRDVTLRTRSFGSRDPEGLAWRPESRSLVVSDQEGGRVFHVRPGRDRRLGTLDDRVRSFRTSSVGVVAPEGVEFDARTGHLLIVGASGELVAEATLRGRLVRTIDISGAGIINASAITLVPPSEPGTTRIVVSDKGVDPDLDPQENDGRLFLFDYST
jgi:hypothetical protein